MSAFWRRKSPQQGDFLLFLWGLVAGTCCGNLLRELVAGTCCGNLLRELVAGTCCGNLLRELVAGTCCGNLLRELVAGTCCGNLLRELVAGTCCGNLLRELVAGTCCGNLLRELVAERIVAGIVAQHSFSSKPRRGQYTDYYEENGYVYRHPFDASASARPGGDTPHVSRCRGQR